MVRFANPDGPETIGVALDDIKEAVVVRPDENEIGEALRVLDAEAELQFYHPAQYVDDDPIQRESVIFWLLMEGRTDEVPHSAGMTSYTQIAEFTLDGYYPCSAVSIQLKLFSVEVNRILPIWRPLSSSEFVSRPTILRTPDERRGPLALLSRYIANAVPERSDALLRVPEHTNFDAVCEWADESADSSPRRGPRSGLSNRASIL